MFFFQQVKLRNHLQMKMLYVVAEEGTVGQQSPSGDTHQNTLDKMSHLLVKGQQSRPSTGEDTKTTNF